MIISQSDLGFLLFILEHFKEKETENVDAKIKKKSLNTADPLSLYRKWCTRNFFGK